MEVPIIISDENNKSDSGVVLDDQHRAHAALLAAHHGAQIRIVNVAASDSRIHTVHTPRQKYRWDMHPKVTSIVPRGRGIYTPPRR